jgi:hypothetical protein
MTAIGEVVAILDDKRVLISGYGPLSGDKQVVVFERLPMNAENLKIQNLDIPKGRLKVVAPQEENFYLAERFREGTTRRKISTNSLGISALLGDQYEEIPGPWSISMQRDSATGLNFSPHIKVGDLIANA